MLTDGWTTDAGVTGILIAHLGAFGSGELKTSGSIYIFLRRVAHCIFLRGLFGIGSVVCMRGVIQRNTQCSLSQS